MLLACKINVAKIAKPEYFKGQKGVYLSFSLSERREPDQYGNTHSIYIYNKDTKEKKYIGEAKRLEFDNEISDADLPPGIDDIEDAEIIPDGKTPF